jgi:hypothetical protein
MHDNLQHRTLLGVNINLRNYRLFTRVFVQYGVTYEWYI